MHSTSPHWDANRVMTEVEPEGRRFGVLLYSHPSSSSAEAAGKLPLHWPDMPSQGRTANKLLLLVAASVVSSAIVIRPDCNSRWLWRPGVAIINDAADQSWLSHTHCNTDWGDQLPSIWIMNSLIEQQCGPVVTWNINSRCWNAPS